MSSCQLSQVCRLPRLQWCTHDIWHRCYRDLPYEIRQSLVEKVVTGSNYRSAEYVVREGLSYVVENFK